MRSVLAALMLSCAGLCLAASAPLQTVAHVDLARYLGQWYELARYPNRFEAQCAREVIAEYKQRSDGRIEVHNRCLRADGVVDDAKGIARVVDAASNAKLQVRFAPAWLAWVPFTWGDYWIVDLAPDYSYAIVGSPSRDVLWVLSRTPSLPDATWQHLIAKLDEQGFEPGRLKRTGQNGGGD